MPKFTSLISQPWIALQLREREASGGWWFFSGGPEIPYLIASVLLCLVERDIGFMQESSTCQTLAAMDTGDAQASGYGERRGRKLFGACADILAEFLEDRAGSSAIGMREEQHELFSAETADDVGLANALGEELGNIGKDDIADGVTELIVDALEVVKIDESHRHIIAVATAARQLALKSLFQPAPIEDVRQRVDNALLKQAPLQPRLHHPDESKWKQRDVDDIGDGAGDLQPMRSDIRIGVENKRYPGASQLYQREEGEKTTHKNARCACTALTAGKQQDSSEDHLKADDAVSQAIAGNVIRGSGPDEKEGQS